MIKAEQELYNFRLINLYWSGENNLEESINTKEKFVKYCIENNITSLSMSTSTYSEELVNYMKDNDLIVYVFTENDENKAKDLLENGVDIVGTDFLI